jgi:hypothetical protein
VVRLPILRDLLARFVGMGFWRVHVEG